MATGVAVIYVFELLLSMIIGQMISFCKTLLRSIPILVNR